MLGAGSSFSTCPKYFIHTKYIKDNPVTDLDSGVERGFPVSLVLTSVIYTSVASPELQNSQFYNVHFSNLKVSC